jgi:hypothetical protein
MGVSLLLWVVLAIVVSWLRGLYIRLASLRGLGVDVLGAACDQVNRYHGVMHLHVDFRHPGLLADGRCEGPELAQEWRQLSLALSVLKEATQSVQRQPLAGPTTDGLRKTVEQVHSAWADLCATPRDLAGPAVPDDLSTQWHAVTDAVGSACGRFNQAAQQYNTALGQFPASLVAGTMQCETVALL